MYYLILLSLAVQDVLTNEYLYSYPQLYDQQSNEYYKDPISVQNLRYNKIEPSRPEANPTKVQYDAVMDEVQTKYLNSPKQTHIKDRYQSLDDRIQKLKLTIGDPKTPTTMKILFGEIVKTYNKYKDGKYNDYEPNTEIEKLMEIYLNPRTPKKYKKIYEEIISSYYRNRHILEPTYKNVNIREDDLNDQFDSEKYHYNPESEEYESETDLNDYNTDISSKTNPRRLLKWFKAWFGKTHNSSTTTAAPPSSQLSQLPQTRDTGKQLFIAPTTELPFTDDSKETETLKNITEVLHKLNLNIEKQNKLAAIIFQNVYNRIAQQNNMNTDRKGNFRFKRDMNSEKNDAEESTITNSTLGTNVTEDVSKQCNCSDAKDGRRVYGRTDGAELIQSSPVKTKLIGYIEETFADIENKMKPVAKIKESHVASNNMFKAGYIVANLDTLEENIKKLKADMDANKTSWDDQAVLDVFDNVMMANKVIDNLLITLKLYLNVDDTDAPPPDSSKDFNEVRLPQSPIVL